MAGSAWAKREARKMADSLGHQMSPFTPYGDKEYSCCKNNACKARLIVQEAKAEGHARSRVFPFLERGSGNEEGI